MIREAGRDAERVRGAVTRCETFYAEAGRDMAREAGRQGERHRDAERDGGRQGAGRQTRRERERDPESQKPRSQIIHKMFTLCSSITFNVCYNTLR